MRKVCSKSSVFDEIVFKIIFSIIDSSIDDDDDTRNKLIKLSVTSIAKRRWKILAKTLCNCPPNDEKPIQFSSPAESSLSDDYQASVRRFACFNLFDRHSLLKDSNQNWCILRAMVGGNEYSVIIHEVRQKLTPADLIGFNNTGNICLWPSEEALAYYVLHNLPQFHQKRILELGGGMTCLAGLFVAKYAQTQFIRLTDGNEVSVGNVNKILKQNFVNFSTQIDCSVLKWEHVGRLDEIDQYDCILSADCLFFDSARSFFIDALWKCMKPDGFALIMAPARGDTLHKFIVQAEKFGFDCVVRQIYNLIIWQKHLNLLRTDTYDENIHYPVLIEVRKCKNRQIK